MSKILFVVNNPAFFLSHRVRIALAAKENGYDVHVATMPGESVKQIVAYGFTHHALDMSRSGTNPLNELKTILGLYRLFKQVRPDLVHLVTIKPVLYGGLAARLAHVPAVVYAISGLGFIFTRQKKGVDLLKTVVSTLYKRALGHKNSRAIFQNDDDCAILTKLGAIRSEQVVMIRGAGVDMNEFAPTPEPAMPITITMAARLLKDKGVMEFVEAAKYDEKKQYVWQLAGGIDKGNPASLTETEFANIGAYVRCLGERKDIAHLYAQSHIVVLPSYREGIPKSLLEAAASGRPIVTTDVPGCRDTIIPNVSGILVPVKNGRAIYEAVVSLAEDAELRQHMGVEGRKLAEREFAMPIIIEKHLEVYRALL
ncbi:glycosyltransferase family 4 protein [Pelistega europaea]|uniref:Glycosyltransferase family 4 protein n=1 Tax=Pelistega europaea TaxID=106147 RepID=A0A7Y4P778_9BURK|nr:glycosyltransferase family 4 protein [Pelistega europaea]NOL50460.1 glycosyltransferase family 4 protein [Pelistega europaea]